MFQLGFFDNEIRLARIDKLGDELRTLNALVDWKIFRPALESVRKKERKNNAGARGYDVVMLFKILILQELYGISDEDAEFLILDRVSFSRFLGLHTADKVPDRTTIWLFREALRKAGLVKNLFDQFNKFLKEQGFHAQKGQIVDASFVHVPVQRNTPHENERIKEGNPPQDWPAAKARQKDVDARWAKKNDVCHFGYKNHISVDVRHKIIRAYEVSDAALHDSNIFQELLAENSSRDVWADSAYRSNNTIRWLKENSFREHIQRKGYRNHPLTDWEKQGNRTRAKVRSRVEHVFGTMAQMTKDRLARGVGLARIAVKTGLRNLSYNLWRFRLLQGRQLAQAST
jgi:IS5 family transposase